MNMLLKKIGLFCFLFLVVAFQKTDAQETFLYLIYDETRVGEVSQVQGVANFLTKLLPANTKRKEFDLKRRVEFIKDVEENFKENSPKSGLLSNKGIVVAAGEGTIEVLAKLNPQWNIIVAFSSHQFTKDQLKLNKVANIVALPDYAVTDDVLVSFESPPSTLVRTIGVPHNLSPEVIQKAYEDQQKLIPNFPAYIGIILGGDAETPDMKMKYYSAEEAGQIASYIARLVKEKKAHLLILNGPRTGKHDQKTGELIKTSHKDGSVDAITFAFIEALVREQLTPGKDFTLFDFRFGKPSMYPAVLGALRKTKSPIFVAGESTSMVSESVDCLHQGMVTVYTNGAMNENHKKQSEKLKSEGVIQLLVNEGGKWNLMMGEETTDSKTHQSDAQMIAEEIMRQYQKMSK